MYEIFVGAITSQIVVGPTGDTQAAELYAAKVTFKLPLASGFPGNLKGRFICLSDL